MKTCMFNLKHFLNLFQTCFMKTFASLDLNPLSRVKISLMVFNIDAGIHFPIIFKLNIKRRLLKDVTWGGKLEIPRQREKVCVCLSDKPCISRALSRRCFGTKTHDSYISIVFLSASLRTSAGKEFFFQTPRA